MGAHIFLASEENFELCARRGIYGCVMPEREYNRAEVVAGVLSIQKEDLIFFYVKNKGIYGAWKAVGEPYFDETPLWSDPTRTFPYRISFEPIIGHFPKPISIGDILDLRDRARIWTFDLSPVQQKNQYKITTDEARELLRLLLRNNPFWQRQTSILEPYRPVNALKIVRPSTTAPAGRVRYEGWLNAWFMQAFSMGQLKDLVGDYREFLNLVPTTFNKVMDIFLTHSTRIEAIDVPYKYTCIELKVDKATLQDLAQILRYEDWLARRLAAGDRQMVQSILVAHSFADDVIDYVAKRHRIEETTVRLVQYRAHVEDAGIDLQEVPHLNGSVGTPELQ